MTQFHSNECINKPVYCWKQSKKSKYYLNYSLYISPGKRNANTSLNLHYIYLFKDPRDNQQITTLARKTYPGATKELYGYLLIDLKPKTGNNMHTYTYSGYNKSIYTNWFVSFRSLLKQATKEELTCLFEILLDYYKRECPL